MVRDFTMAKYGELCRALLGAGYTPATVYQYLTDPPGGRTVVLRHDVDRKPENALKMAELEHAFGITSTYYFRHPVTFVPEVIREIHALGHEVGYHYEVLAKAKGDYEEAIGLFASELEELRGICDVRTICMHGSPLSRYDNRDLWHNYDFRQFSIVGEAYLSLQGTNLCYFTDTGRNWDGKHSRRDVFQSMEKCKGIHTTSDLINVLTENNKLQPYITIHPERWAISGGGWLSGYLKDNAINMGKKLIMAIQA
ncbi:hypothetical protein F8E02_04010 [Methanoculleus sp. Wushi-C6]|uniref:Polysaccharide deacetylase n=1 Tax=Methanoculleus caldifontis TaxID=2651577 RepID=A0ABU3WZP9_9EURY|nr:hypothetical protein [Methanoculleus sp. Wushi-C6]MDV2481186.1 hypothetical protein [Methanoculleus sp. Wushi-C6]